MKHHPSAVHTQKNHCPVCYKEIDMALSVDLERVTPKKGDFSICAYCKAISVFQEDGSLGLANEEEAKRVATLFNKTQFNIRRN